MCKKLIGKWKTFQTKISKNDPHVATYYYSSVFVDIWRVERCVCFGLPDLVGLPVHPQWPRSVSFFNTLRSLQHADQLLLLFSRSRLLSYTVLPERVWQKTNNNRDNELKKERDNIDQVTMELTK